MLHNRVKSSVIAALDYAPEHARLEVTFHTGRVYHYFLVPRSTFEALLAAESIGRFFNEEIRNRFRCTEVTPGHYPRHSK